MVAFSFKRPVFPDKFYRLKGKINKPTDVKITSLPSIEKYGQHYQPKVFPYYEGVLKDNSRYIDYSPF